MTGAEAVSEYAQMLSCRKPSASRGWWTTCWPTHGSPTSTEVYTFERQAPAELIEDVLRRFQHQLSDGGFEVVVDVPAGTAAGAVDRTAMRLALDNLIDNAIRYPVTIDAGSACRPRAEHDASRIEVQDRGIGIPADEIALVQTKFVRGRSAPAPAATGSGSPSCRGSSRTTAARFDIASSVGERRHDREFSLPAFEG